MKRLIATTLAVVFQFLVASAVAAQTSVSIGIQIGPPPPPRVVYVPPPPRPEYVWIPGYWYPVKHKHKHKPQYEWHDGYWTRPPYPGAHWVAARYDGRMFYDGYWIGDHGRREHDHDWDHKRDRDYGHENDQGHHRGHEDRD